MRRWGLRSSLLAVLGVIALPGAYSDPESDALLEFKDGLEDKLSLSSWGPGAVCQVDDTTWTGTTCKSGHVVSLSLNSRQLKGTIAVINPQKLKLWLLITPGTLPWTWSNLSRLQSLEMGDNNISGTLPPSWGQLSDLQHLFFSRNKLSGSLPPTWSNLSMLQSLDVGINELTGPLPGEWNQLESLQSLALGFNHLTGSLPQSWSSLTSLQSMDIGLNSISGTLPEAWNQLRSLQSLPLGYNQLIGSLPQTWSNLSSLRSLDIRGNKLSGPLPGEWDQLDGLQALRLGGNQLTGCLPQTWSSLRWLQVLDISANSVSGTLPEQWERLKSLQSLLLASNQLTGSIPEGWLTREDTGGLASSIQSLDLSENRLCGSLPADANLALGKAAQLTLDPMSVGYGLCGPIPASITVNSTAPGVLRSCNGSSYSVPPGSWKCSCPQPPSGGPDGERVVEGVIGVIVSFLVLATCLAAFAFYRLQQSRKSGVYTRLSARLESSLLSLELELERDKQGKLVLLGHGTTGKVYKARWRGGPVAVKVVFTKCNPAQVENSRREGDILKALCNRHVVSYYDVVVEDNGQVLLVTELMEGSNLRDCISTDVEGSRTAGTPRRMGWSRQGPYIALGIVRGLAYLHGKGVIWYNGNPSNVFLDRSRVIAKISDFGMFKLFSDNATAGCGRGTPRYRAPELRVQRIPLYEPITSSERSFSDHASADIYSFGVVLFEIVTGESYREEGSEGHRLPWVPEECPEAIVDLCQACLSVNPNSRPTASNVLEFLEDDLVDLLTAAAQPTDGLLSAPPTGEMEMVWSAAVEAGQPSGNVQLSICLAVDKPAAHIKALVEGWIRQQQSSCATSWQSAVVTVRQLAGALLHVLFFMPPVAHMKLVDAFHGMTGLGESSRYCSFEGEFRDCMALTAMMHMLQQQGLAPKDWRLSTACWGKEVVVELSSVSEAGFAIQRIDPASIPAITQIYLWTAADPAERRLVIHGNEAFRQAGLQACPAAGENPVEEPEAMRPVPPRWLERQANLWTLARWLHTGVYFMPRLSMRGAFRIEAVLEPIVLHYPGVPLNLLKIAQHLPDTSAPLQEREQKAIARLPGVLDWRAAAKAHAPPRTCAWDVFISHAGDAADKPFARALKALLERTGWGLRVFLDDESLVPAGDARRDMRKAMESTAVAVLLFSAEFFERGATKAELQVLLARHAAHRVQLLPVFLRLRVEDCERELAKSMGQENVDLPTGIRHLGEPSTLQPGMDKVERETLWHIAHALSVLLLKDFSAGVASYAASEASTSPR